MSAIRVGLVAPCLLAGGGETYQLVLRNALVQYPPTRTVCWQGVVSLDSASAADPNMLAATSAAFGVPVTFGEAALKALAAQCDLLIAWAPYPYAILGASPKVVFICHRGEAWGAGTVPWLSTVSRFVAVSATAAAAVPATFAAITTTIPTALDVVRLQPATTRAAKRASWGVPGSAWVVGYLGRLAPEKDPGALGRAAASSPATTFVAVGAGSQPMAAALAAMPSNLVVTGSDLDVAGCLAAFDTLVNPSKLDTFGFSVAQAWFLGLPVISTPVGIAASQPNLIRSIPIGADGPTIAAAIAADRADAVGTAARVAAALAWARTNLALPAFARSWAAILDNLAL